MTEQLPLVAAEYLPFWEVKFARCIKDDPPRRHVGLGRNLKVGDVIEINGVVFSIYYELAAPKECSFYQMEGYFEPILTA